MAIPRSTNNVDTTTDGTWLRVAIADAVICSASANGVPVAQPSCQIPRYGQDSNRGRHSAKYGKTVRRAS